MEYKKVILCQVSCFVAGVVYGVVGFICMAKINFFLGLGVWFAGAIQCLVLYILGEILKAASDTVEVAADNRNMLRQLSKLMQQAPAPQTKSENQEL